MPRWQRRVWLLLAIVAIGIMVVRARARPVGGRGDRSLARFSLRGTDGRLVTLSDFAAQTGIVLIFTGSDCPNSNKSLPHLMQLAARYQPQGIAFLGVNSNASASIADVAAHAQEHGISFPVCKDPNNIVADLAGVERTCEVVVLDRGGVVRYHGAIDDQFGRGTSKSFPTRHYLADALDAILEGRPVEVALTKAVGCPIERIKSKAAPARIRPANPAIVHALETRERGDGPVELGQVDYARDVVSIVQQKCQSCHRPGQEAPFPLLSYDDARSRAESIREVIEDRRMPPWHADPRFGHFANDRSLTTRERAILLAWIAQGAPPGDPALLPPPRSFPAGWSIGTPDMVFTIPQANEVPAVGVLDYVIIVVPTNFQQDMWVQAAEIRPEVRSIVHHIIVQILEPGARPSDRGSHLATYVPGDAPTTYSDGIAKLIPAGSLLKFGIHYTPDGLAHTDRSKIGLVFSKTPVRHRAFTRSVENSRFSIPPHAGHHPVAATFTTSSAIRLYSFAPHMHVRGKDFRYTATYPDGRTETLLSVPAYDFGWQSTYILAEPKAIPRGTRIDCLAHFDNSTNNPANPDPAQQVEWGEQSFQEMMIGYFDFVSDALADRQ